jgi:hypothetical protein
VRWHLRPPVPNVINGGSGIPGVGDAASKDLPKYPLIRCQAASKQGPNHVWG